MSVEVGNDIEPLREEWAALALATGAPPFVFPGFVDVWWEVFGTGRLEILTNRREGALTGVLCLYRRRDILKSTSNAHSAEFASVFADEADLGALAAAVADRTTTRTSLILVDASRPVLSAVRGAAEARGLRVVERVLHRSPYVDLTGGWDAYARSVGTKRLADLRRRRRRLTEQGEVTVEFSGDRTDLDARLDEGFRVEALGWKGDEGTAIASRPETMRFYRSMSRWAAGRGWLRLAFLRLDGVAIAFELDVVHGGVLYRLKGGFDPAYARFAPGHLLVHDVLQRAPDEGITRYDFLGADEPWKLDWSKATRPLVVLQLFAPTVRGLAAWTALTKAVPLLDRLDSFRGR